MTWDKGCFLVLVSMAFEIGVTGEATVAPMVTECKDALDTYGLLDTSYYCVDEFRNWAIEHCQRTCNLCGQATKPTISTSKPAISTSTATRGPHVIIADGNYCFFGNEYYNTGDTWHVGCSQTCTCKHIWSGYTCRGRCLTWNNLPPNCSLEAAPPGLCCEQPRCPEAIVVTVPRAFKEEYPGYKLYEPNIIG